MKCHCVKYHSVKNDDVDIYLSQHVNVNKVVPSGREKLEAEAETLEEAIKAIDSILHEKRKWVYIRGGITEVEG